MLQSKIVGLIIAQLAYVGATSDANHQFSLHRQISFNPDGESTVDGETESFNFYKSDQDKNVLSSEEAPMSLFFHGGACNDAFVGYGECAFVPTQRELGDSVEDESDDDDDDQDDGHSSMLSNRSIERRSRISVVGGEGSLTSFAKHSVKDSVASLKNLRSSGKGYDSLLLNVRGGAQVADEATKRLIVSALVTLIYEGSLGHILEFLKIAMQTASPGTSYASIIQNITSKKGVAGLWDGK